MNLTLANPALLPLAALVTLPILIHFFARARPRTLPFSSIRFIEEIVRKTARIQQPRSWLILLLRTLLFAAIIGLFLRPMLMAPVPLAGQGERKNVLLLIDASASMSAVEGPRTRFAAACARASEIIAGLSSGDLANMIWIRGQSAPEFPTMAVNKTALQQAVQTAGGSIESADLHGAFNQAEALLRGTKGAREVYVLSDFQDSNWQDFSPPDLPGTRLIFIRAGEEEIPNQAIVELLPSSRKPLVGEEVELTCRVANHSSQPVLRTVFLRSGELTQSRDIRLPPWSEGSVTFLTRFTQAGERPVDFSLTEDDFPADNSRRLLLEIKPHLTVGISGSDEATADKWARALSTVEWIQVVRADPTATFTGDVWMFAGWDGSHPDLLQAFLQSGGTLVVAPAPGLPLAELQTLAGLPTTPETLDFVVAREPFSLRVADPKHPVFAVFGNGQNGDPAGGRFAKRLELTEGSWPDEGMLLAYQDGQPAVAEWGRLIFWNLDLAASEPAWAERMEFVPFLAELALAGRRSSGLTPIGESPAGTPITRQFPADILDHEITITGPSGEIPAERTSPGSTTFQSSRPLEPGLYEWLAHGSGAGFSVINFPSVESDLRMLTNLPNGAPDTMTLAVNENVSTLREGLPLWPWLLALACLCLLTESLVVWKTRPMTA